MSYLQWRRFNFFEKEIVLVPPATPQIRPNESHSLDFPTSSRVSDIDGLDQIKAMTAQDTFEKIKDLNVTCSSSGRGHIVLGDCDGFIHMINRQFHTLSFKAFEISVTHVHQMIQNPYLISAGTDEPGINPLVKIWSQEKYDRYNRPLCTRVIRAVTGVIPSPIISIAVLDTLTHMAVGFGDGYALMFRGDVTREKHSKQKLIKISESPITNLAYRNLSGISAQILQQQNNVIMLLVTTTKEILCYNVTHKDKETKVILENEFGCEPSCFCLMNSPKDDGSHMVVGRKDAIYFFQSEGRGPCLAFEGEKVILFWFRGYLIVVGKETNTSANETLSGYRTKSSQEIDLSDQKAELRSSTSIVTVYDIHNKFIAFSSPVPQVNQVFAEWGSIYLLTKAGQLVYLREKDTTFKLDLLFKKNQYSLAIELAKSNQYDTDGLADIFKQYGDHLYKKGDHDGAIAQYIKTVGRLEASYVIRKFLDAQRIPNLTAYLEALHKNCLANKDHTTLLLNCYTKLENDETTKLDKFIKGSLPTALDGSSALPPMFDVETAIKVLRQANFLNHAIFLAEKYGRHDWFFKIQLEDKEDANKALEYMKKNLRPMSSVVEYIKKYGRFLMDKEPEKTTELIKSLCAPPRKSTAASESSSIMKSRGESGNKPDHLEGIFLLGMGFFLSNDAETEESTFQPNPDDFLHIFVKNSTKLMEFLEYIVTVLPETATVATYNTLLDIYLQSFRKEVDEDKKQAIEKKIMDFLQDPETKCEIKQAMILCQLNCFVNGILHLLEKSKQYNQLLHHYIRCNNHDKVIETCRKFGNDDSNLWIDALWYFSKAGNNKVIDVLQEIEKRKLLSVSMVINILASHGSDVKLNVVKDYLFRSLNRESEMITENDKYIKQYETETDEIRRGIEEMRTNAKVFQASKCSGCNNSLELPSVHFICSHSYHQQCFEGYSSESDSDCPLCLPRDRKILSLILQQDDISNLNQSFTNEVYESDDTFSVISSYFSKGIFNKPIGKEPNKARPLNIQEKYF